MWECYGHTLLQKAVGEIFFPLMHLDSLMKHYLDAAKSAIRNYKPNA